MEVTDETQAGMASMKGTTDISQLAASRQVERKKEIES